MLVEQLYNRLFNLTLVLTLTLLLAGCPVQDKQQKETSEEQVVEEKNESENPKQLKKAVLTPQVSTSTSQESKPISDFSGNAEDYKHDELYLIPNHFPLENREKQQLQEDEKPPAEVKEDPPGN